MYALPVSMPPSSQILVPMSRSHGSSPRQGLSAIWSIAVRMESRLPTVGKVCESATRVVRAFCARRRAYCATDPTLAPRSATVVKPLRL